MIGYIKIAGIIAVIAAVNFYEFGRVD